MAHSDLRSRNSTRPWRAFSLVEAVLVVVIVGIFSSIALPRYAGFVAREQVQAAAQRIVTDLSLAQRQARLSSASQQVVFDLVAGSYTLINLPDPDRKEETYKVTLSQEPYRVNIVSANFGGDGTLIYDGFGTPDSGGTIVIGVGKYTQTITVNVGTGQVVKPKDLQIVAVE